MFGEGKVQGLTGEFEPLLDSFLREDVLLNAYPIFDLHHMRQRSKFFIVYANKQIQGVLLDFHGHAGFHSIWLRGTNKAIEKLLDVLKYDKMLFMLALPENEKAIERKFPTSNQHTMDFMLLRRGGESLYVNHSARQLSQSDSFALASLRKKTHESPLKEEVERASEIIKDHGGPPYGIFDNSMLISVCTFHVRLPEIWIIGGLYTRPEYRNQGYATSLTSIMIKDALRETECIGLYVREDNYPAKRIYEKIGIKLHKKVKWLDYNTGFVP
jgi:RimJ/RimL family protein N-acetyltransferase